MTYHNNSVFPSGDQDYDSANGWDPDAEEFKRLVAEAKKKNPRFYNPRPEMLYVKDFEYYQNEGAALGPVKQLFGPFWQADEVAVLYARPGVGKTALAVQIAESLARGRPIEPFTDVPEGSEVAPKRVLYLDFELTREQFSVRYCVSSEADGTAVDKYEFRNEYLRRTELWWNGRLIDGYEDFTDMLFTDIENRVDEHNSEVLIVDNITFLSRSSTVNSSIAFRLMNRLQQLKKDRFISILAVAHTPKLAAHRPLTENDLQGSIDLAKVADSMFVVGASHRESDVRYVKHIKARTGRIVHGECNVVMYRLHKFDFAAKMSEPTGKPNFFGFDFVGFDREWKHLAEPLNIARAKRRPRSSGQMIDCARSLRKQGLSISVIAERLGVGKSTAHRYLSSRKTAVAA